MNVEIRAVRDKGDLNKERLVIKVLSNDDIGQYLVLDTTYLPNGRISNKVQHPYWFPDKQVNEGDLVVLYSKVGTNYSKDFEDGTQTHFFYRGLEKSVWNESGDCAVVFKVAEWTNKKV